MRANSGQCAIDVPWADAACSGGGGRREACGPLAGTLTGRRRHILLAAEGPQIDAADLLEMQLQCGEHDERTVESVIALGCPIAAGCRPDR